MAQKTSDSDDQPNPSSSSTKEIPGPAAAQKQSTSHTSSSPAPAPPNASTLQSSSTTHTTTTTTTAKPLDSKQSGENAAHANTQPMSKSNSAASSTLSKDAMAGPSPYGTRSRNRGQARPNYAEDRDLDVEMEDAFPEKKEEEPKKGARQSNATTNGTGEASKATASSSRKGAAADDSKGSGSHGTGKDAHSSTSTTTGATGPTTSSGPSKKRKAATQSSTNNARSQASTPTPTSTTSAATGTRRGAAQVAALPTVGYRETNMMSFEKCGAMPKDGRLIADDGTVLEQNDHVYLVCEPPGEPYYLGRIMEFVHPQNNPKKPVESLKLNWYYRPKDIGKRVNDTRLVFATMHTDISPLSSLRGKCQIRHKAEIEDMETYRKTPDCFWYEKLYDRYIQKYYEMIPCFQIVNVPEKVKKVLDERWKYILVEQGRGKEFTSAVKLCKRCNGYCASHDSVDCAVCQQTYHMRCVRPALTKKPSRGFAWACAACSRAQERKLEARHTPSLLDSHQDGEEEEFWDEEDDGIDTSRTSPADEIDDSHQPATQEQIYQASLWPFRYLGMHCKPEDALDWDDRIYPRAASRLGPKHQATVLPWPGRPLELVKPLEIKRGSKKEAKATKEALAAAVESERNRRENRPWIQDEPPGYVARGEDLDNDDPNNTAQLLWKPCDDTTIVPYAGFPKTKQANKTISIDSPINNYLRAAKSKIIPVLGLPKESTNFLDVAINTLFKNNYKTDAALRVLDRTEKSAFKEPDLSAAEVKKFEEGVSKYGSELYLVSRHVKSVKHARIVRFYYAWKTSDHGKRIWGNFSGRKVKKEGSKAEMDASKLLQDDVANDHDDSAFDTDKAVERKRNFMCRFCATKSSRQWRRAPNSASTVFSDNGGKGANKEKVQYIVALCRRCAELWRRYAIQWEDMEDLAKKVASAGGRSWKRRVDEELLKELRAAEEMMNMTVYSTPTRSSPAARATPPVANPQSTTTDPPPRKKLKTIGDKHAEQNGGDNTASVPAPPPKKKEKPAEKPLPPPPPPAPELPKLRTLPCAVCNQGGNNGEQVICCKDCRLTVHRSCYGIPECRNKDKWTCDMCMNDKVPQVSIAYKCILCPVEKREHDFMEPPKNTHKKKTEKDREKERTDRELALKAIEVYQKRQVELRRPVNPREALKRTADNNWVHATCAVWAPEIKFSSAKALCVSEGIPSIPHARYEEVCKVCRETGGACVPCHCCRAPVHVECAHKSGYLLGFEITPVKGSRRDQHNIVTIGGETGSMSALIWCKEHIPQKTVVHRMHDVVKDEDGQPSNISALQLYVRNFKQADLTLTGTVRKANLVNLVTKTTTNTLPTNPNRRHSSTTAALPCQRDVHWPDHAVFRLLHQRGDKACITCGIDVSPKWHKIDKTQEKILTNGYTGTMGDAARMFLAQRQFQCHKCKTEGRQPVPHLPSPPVETQAEAIEPLRPPPIINPSAAPNSPHHASHAVTRMNTELGNSWPPRAAPTVQPPLALGQASLHGPPGATPQPLPLTAPRTGPSPIAAPGPPPVAAHSYSASSSSYGEWQRSTAPPPVVTSHPISSSSTGTASIHHNHLRDLRPPPIASVSHHQVAPIQHGLGQPIINGAPPSPRRGPPTVHSAGSPFGNPYHTPTHPSSLHNLTMVGHLHASQHRSPPVSRDGVSLTHETSISNNTNATPAPPRLNDGRPANGASASPSLRNLLI
ncbi:hypothetical protein NPX13_g7168 [Xylaria arbuscula]|uniref:Uncharacterized protein n=1 Tax=Xylaria arbuscula TaxID=114810 RepID=A0A9W8NB73_9PEZI|nr:hypothetical protein NPX13_g7168 [Xylaria arbuscula]